MSPIRLLKCCLNFTHLWCQESPALFSGSLGKPWSVSCVHPGSLGSRLSHSMSLGVDCEPHEGRSDTPVCLVVDLQICSHTHWKQWKPLDTVADLGFHEGGFVRSGALARARKFFANHAHFRAKPRPFT